jgi:hypothetical protein
MNDAIIKKIQKLLARGSTDHNDNEHEREIAMRQAHALLAKHGLAMADVTDPAVIRDHLGPLGRSFYSLGTRYLWEPTVWNSIARLNGCRVVRGDRKVAVIGRQARVQVVASMAAYVIAAVTRQAKAEGFPIAGFGQGASIGVDRQVSKILESMAAGDVGEEKVSTGTALILVDQHKGALVEAKTAMKEFYPSLRTVYSRGSSNRSARSAGYAYGQKVSLNSQLGSGAGRPALGA